MGTYEDELANKKQDIIIAELQAEIHALRKDTIETSEKRRGWVRAGMVGWFCTLISYIVILHTGTADGEIKPEIIWSFATGVLVTKILDHYINTNTKTDRVL